MMQIKVFCMVVLCAFLFIACEKDNDDYEPIKPPVEQPEEPVKPEKPDEPEKPEKPTTPPATDDIINVKIGDSNMIVGSNNWNAITYGNGKYVAVGEKGYVTMSTNGVDWSTPKQVGSKVWHAITYANGKFVAVGGSGYSGQKAFVTYSTNGIEWATPVSIPSLYGDLCSITFGNGKFVAVGYHEYGGREYGYVTTSTDGVTWTSAIKIGEDTGTQLMSVAFGNGKFVAIGDGYATTSENGISWSSLTRISYDSFYSIIYAKDKFIICGSNTVIYTSTDIITFEQRFAKPGTSSLISLLYDNGCIVALRKNGYYLLSSDGINWSEPAQIKDESGKVVTATLNGVCTMP